MKLALVITTAILIAACTAQLALKMKCSGDCELEIERGIDVPAPTYIGEP